MNATFPGIFSTDFSIDYPLEWIDRLVTVSLIPENIGLASIDKDTQELITKKLKDEQTKLQLLIKSQTFTLANEEDICVLVRRYHSSLLMFLNQALENKDALCDGDGQLFSLCAVIIEWLENLLTFLEHCYMDYLSLDEKVPPGYLSRIQSEIMRKLKGLEPKIRSYPHAKTTTKLVLRRIKNFIDSKNTPYQITFRKALYEKELVNKLEKLNWDNHITDPFTAIDEMLIYINYNSKEYMKLLALSILTKINIFTDPIEKVVNLHYYYKAFMQIHQKPDMVLNPKFHDLVTVFENWFKLEISYMEKEIKFSVFKDGEETDEEEIKDDGSDTTVTKVAKQKVMWMLSADQIALIIRAADESRIILAKSLNAVFHVVVPHISTQHTEELSPPSVRSKSYNAEQTDKEIAIGALEKMITKIKGY